MKYALNITRYTTGTHTRDEENISMHAISFHDSYRDAEGMFLIYLQREHSLDKMIVATIKQEYADSWTEFIYSPEHSFTSQRVTKDSEEMMGRTPVSTPPVSVFDVIGEHDLEDVMYRARSAR